MVRSRINRPKSISNMDKKDLLTLAYDLLLTKNSEMHHRVTDIIQNCKSYDEGHRKIMKMYDEIYM